MILLGVATGLFIIVMMDRLTSYDPIEDDHTMALLPVLEGPPEATRVFVYLIDSLLYETSMDPTIMPHLMQLRSEGVSARVKSIFNSVTGPSVSSIFTGREDVSLLGSIKNFIKSDGAGVESLFAQVHQAGMKSEVCAGSAFDQFGPVITRVRRRELDYSMDRNDQQLLDAAAAMARGESQFTVAHLPYTDYIAHEYNVGHVKYREQFRRADALIPRLRALLPAGTTFIVMGDHGHTFDGRHGSGLDLYTTSVYTGKPFLRGRDIGTIHLPSNRYLLSAAVGLPMPVFGYVGQLYPEALASRESSAPATGAGLTALRPRPHSPFSGMGQTRLLLYLGFGLVIALWINAALPEWSPFHFQGWHLALAWLPLGACFLPLGYAGAAIIGAGLLVVCLLKRRASSRLRGAAWTAGIVAIACLLHGWGRFLAATEKNQQSLPPAVLVVAWMVAGGIGAWFATRQNRTLLSWLWLGVPAALLMPTNAPFGWSSVIMPALACWFLFYLISFYRERREEKRPLTRSELIGLGAPAVLALLLFQAQAANQSVNYLFHSWYSLIPGWNVDNMLYMAVAGTAATFILLCPHPERSSSRLVALSLSVLLYPLQWRLWEISPPVWAGLLTTAVAAWQIARWRKSEHARALGTWVGLAAWCYLFRPPHPNHAAVCCMLAALALASRFLRRFPQPENTSSDRLFLWVLGSIIAGHAICRWSVTDMEWKTAYDWFAAGLVERFAVVVLIGIIFKGLVPWLVMRQATGGTASSDSPSASAGLRAILSVKCASVIMIMTGLGAVPNAVGPYTEAAQQSVVLGILALYALMF